MSSKLFSRLLLISALFLSVCLQGRDVPPYGLIARPAAKPFLLLPDTEAESNSLPRLLSQTGAFADTPSLKPNPALLPYDLNVPFWSDGAAKSRWIALPNEPASRANFIGFAPAGEWTFPAGTVFVKHFELATDETNPSVRRRLETRFLVCTGTGQVYGVTYKWRSDNSDAELLNASLNESIAIKTVAGWRTQQWYYPSRADCHTCHTTNAVGVLGVKTRQLNRDFTYAQSSATDNQLRTWNHLGLFNPPLDEDRINSLPRITPQGDHSVPVEQRARSYLDANCSQCHRPGGVVSYFDARYDTPLAAQGLVNGPVVIDNGIDQARVIAPNDPWRSIALQRINTLDPIKMPPLAHEVMDRDGVELLTEWIKSLPGPEVLAPPTMSPKGGEFKQPIKVTLNHADPQAEIHYTTDGSVPAKSAALYRDPVTLEGPVTLRAKAFKPGFTKSITVQETFVVGE